MYHSNHQSVFPYLFFFISMFPLLGFSASREDARFIWTDTDTTQRHVYVWFQLEIDINDAHPVGKIHTFADSRYHLFVNGNFVNFGPARTFPEKPEFDTYDLTYLLQQGKNTIRVKALWNGMETYQLLKNKPGFIAWGEIKDGNQTISLATPGTWQSIKDPGYDQTAPRFSFAQGVIDVYDARKGFDFQNVNSSNPPDWHQPVVVPWQQTWGELMPRPIKHLNQKEFLPREVTGVYHLDDNEDFYSFRMRTSDNDHHEYHRLNLRAFLITNIYSPKDQTVAAGLWWGEFFLNGKGPLEHQGEIPGQNGRRRVDLQLKRGWNQFFISYNIIWGSWEFYMALPKDAQLILSPFKNRQSEIPFLTAGPFTPDENENIIKKLPLPFGSVDDLPGNLSATWVERTRNESANNPAIEITWRKLADAMPFEQWKVSDITVEAATETAIMFDHGENGYGRIFIEYEAPEGTIIDMAWEEDNTGGKPNINKRFGLFTAAQHTAREGLNYFETFKPYGHRYLQINVRNHSDDVTIKRVGKIEQLYPLEKTGSFECSDEMLNAIWELGWRTIRICAEDIYLDPFRERGLYAGDVLAQSTLAWVTAGNADLTRKSLAELQGLYRDVLKDYPNVSTDRHGIGLLGDYPVISLITLEWYFNLSGDTLFLKESYPNYKMMMDSLATSRLGNGAIWHGGAFLEWIPITKDASHASVHALIADAYRAMAVFAGILGYMEDQEEYTKLHRETAKLTQNLFWDTEKGAFFDGFTPDGEKINSWFPVSSAWPVLYNVATENQSQQINSFLERELEDIGNTNRRAKTTPYGGQYVLGALYKMENARMAEFFMKKYWSHMILQGDDTAWENFYFDPHESKSHGWSGAPTWYLSTQVLGVQLGFPDPTPMDTIVISPQAETIDWATGIVPHPLGLVKVSWKIIGNKLFLDYEAPENVPVVIQPKGRLAKLELIIHHNSN